MQDAPKILIVDDQSTMRELITIALECGGFAVTQAFDGVHGLEVLKTQMPDVIVTDLNMPRLNGTGLIEAVRRNPEFDHVPILVLSSEDASVYREKARNAGASGWMVKPFSPTKLISAVQQLANEAFSYTPEFPVGQASFSAAPAYL